MDLPPGSRPSSTRAAGWPPGLPPGLPPDRLPPQAMPGTGAILTRTTPPTSAGCPAGVAHPRPPLAPPGRAAGHPPPLEGRRRRAWVPPRPLPPVARCGWSAASGIGGQAQREPRQTHAYRHFCGRAPTDGVDTCSQAASRRTGLECCCQRGAWTAKRADDNRLRKSSLNESTPIQRLSLEVAKTTLWFHASVTHVIISTIS